mgnify:CR=1 FL=1
MNFLSIGIGVFLAFTTFLPSLFYTNIAIIALTYFLRIEYKYFNWIVLALIVFIISFFLNTFLSHNAEYWKHFLLYLFIVSPILLAIFTNISTDVKILETFIIAHVYLSVFEFPLQLFQFVSYYGLNFSELMINSSAGDIAKGTIGNSALLAYKQILSILLVLMFPALFSRYRTLLLVILVVSFLLIGANHSLILFLLAVVLAFLFDKPSMKMIFAFISLSVVGAAFMFFVFHSQVQYIVSTLSRFDLESFPRYKVFLEWFDYSNFNEILQTFLAGSGPGSLGSRASYILSGEYLWGGTMPLLGVSMMETFKSVMLPLWNSEITSNLYISGTYYMPFSTYVSIFLEYGIIVFLLFCYFVFYCVLLLQRNLGFVGAVFGLFVAVMLAVDNFVEYPRFFLPILLTVFYISRLECRK